MSEGENENPFELTPKERQSVRFSIAGKLAAKDRDAVKRALQGITLKFGAADGSDWWVMRVAMAGHSLEVMREALRTLHPDWAKSPKDVGIGYRVLIMKQAGTVKAALQAGGDLGAALESAVALGAILAEARLFDRLARDTSAGKGVRRGNRKGNIALHGPTPTAEKHAAFRTAFEKYRLAGCSKGDAYEKAGKEHGKSSRIIRKAVTGK